MGCARGGVELRGDLAAVVAIGLIRLAADSLAASGPEASMSRRPTADGARGQGSSLRLERVEAEGGSTRASPARVRTLAREGQPDLPVIPVLVAHLPPGADPGSSSSNAPAAYLDGVRVVPVEASGARVEQRADGALADFVFLENPSI